MSSLSDPERSAVCGVGPFAGGFLFQSSQSRLKRFIMFDQSNGKGRVFLHPAVAQERCGPAPTRDWDSKGLIPDKEVKAEYSASSLVAYRQMVEGAFTSLQSLRASRQTDVFLQKAEAWTIGTRVSSQNPRVSETIAKVHGNSWIVEAQDAPQPCVASETLVCEEKPKVLAILPSTETMQDCEPQTFMACSPKSARSQLSGPKRSEVAVASDLLHENTEDLDALLSSDEDDDDDDEVRSTGHSPDELPGEEAICGEDEGDEVEQYSGKRRRTSHEHEFERSTGVHKDLNMAKARSGCGNACSNRRQKIKKTVKALRRMIPGGTLLNTAFVLDKTIMYVKNLRERVNQLEATRAQANSGNPHC